MLLGRVSWAVNETQDRNKIIKHKWVSGKIPLIFEKGPDYFQA